MSCPKHFHNKNNEPLLRLRDNHKKTNKSQANGFAFQDIPDYNSHHQQSASKVNGNRIKSLKNKFSLLSFRKKDRLENCQNNCENYVYSDLSTISSSNNASISCLNSFSYPSHNELKPFPTLVPIQKDNIERSSLENIKENAESKVDLSHDESKSSVFDRTVRLSFSNKVISIPINVDHLKGRKQYVLTDPYERLKRYILICMIQKHSNYLRDINDFQNVKIIGKGGFGNVWLSKDLKTGADCAVKQLFSQDLKGRKLTSYQREVETMIKCRNKFICPLVGFTIEPPYSIITQYMPGGTLYNAVLNTDKDGKSRVPLISGTHLTISVLCIAYAMKYLHSQGVLHRDLKANNVLIGNDGLPYLADFGVSRIIENSNRRYSKDVGTHSHMAPEVYKGLEYNEKADVFSFGMLLFEVGEKRHPYVKGDDAAEKIIKGERPSFSDKSDITHQMKKLIVKCWADNPEKRPSFKEIFEVISEGKAFYRNTDTKVLKDFVKKLNKEERINETPNRRHTFYSKDQIQAKYVDSHSIIRKLTHELRQKVKTEESCEITNENNDLKEDHSNEVNVNAKCQNLLENLTNEFDSKNYEEIQQIIISNLKFSPKLIIQTQVSLIKIEKKCLDFIISQKILEAIPLDYEYSNEIMELLCIVSYYLPLSFTQEIENIIAFYREKEPLKALIVFSHYYTHLQCIEDGNLLLNQFVNNAPVYTNIEEGTKYIDFIYDIFKHHPKYFEQKISSFIVILNSFMESNNDSVLSSTLRLFCIIYKDDWKLNTCLLMSCLGKANLCNYVFHLLKKCKDLPKSHSLAKILDTFSLSNIEAMKALMNFAITSHGHARYVAKLNNWIQGENEYVYSLFMYLFAIPDLKKHLTQSKHFPELLANMALTKEDLYYRVIKSIMMSIELTERLIENLEKHGFFIIMLNSAQDQNHSEYSNGINDIIHYRKKIISIFILCARIHCVDSYKLYLPFLFEQLKKADKLKEASIYAIATISFFDEMKPLLYIPKIIDYFKRLEKIDSMERLSSRFLSNLSAYNNVNRTALNIC
ncbi:hypothetical protein TRFO_29281 [Tritrichomonas foetus]|uniref:Protein kinase domain-containing protein n=1 Tax=Tritrichomonas foetus TaxID=1144522 RepID=A0A1J4K0T5_9EUKA|nr:hypothetical protein TRFO_29281 [Tritrichomonas foetus]|eukprot:OHT03358.1 hypothetical protein TRFO_29281 [Tritrichomonas foetus]